MKWLQLGRLPIGRFPCHQRNDGFGRSKQRSSPRMARPGGKESNRLLGPSIATGICLLKTERRRGAGQSQTASILARFFLFRYRARSDVRGKRMEFNSKGSVVARRRHGFAVVAIAPLLLSACGGSSPPAPTPTPTPVANRAPVFTSATSASVVENITKPVYQATASDPDGDALTFSITGGADATSFTINASGQLSFDTPPNFDLPGDANGDNVYEVQISVTDGKIATALALTVTVTNSKEGVAVHRIATGFTDPVAIAPINDTMMLVADKAGAIYLLNPQSGSKTLLVQIANVGTVGVTAIAAGTTFASDGTFFVMYATPAGLVINRYLRNPAGPTVPDNYGPLLAVSASHYAGGGWLGYDANGVLLAATGDAGGTGDPTGSAQDDSSDLGKVISFTPNPDPYAGASAQFFILKEIAKGLHEPNGGSVFNRGLLIADHGENIAEEIDFLPTADSLKNFGWPFKEGTQVVRDGVPAGVVDPIAQYPHGTSALTGQAIVGGATGPSAVASLRDQYVFADGDGAIFAVDASSIQQGMTLPSSKFERRDEDFVPDRGAIDHAVAVTPGPAGTLYIVDADGDIFRVDGE
ncbi:hypothetical protein EAH79_13760 [Sphingomonas koreensis]|nr:hypothetical protein EAH79_13760 [Sphingomonas koreensis]